MKLSLRELRIQAEQAGFTGHAADIAAAVAMAESGGDPHIDGDPTLGISRGLWQINLRAHPEFDALSLYDPLYNARAAFLVSKSGTNWSPWTTFKTGAYLKYMPGGVA